MRRCQRLLAAARPQAQRQELLSELKQGSEITGVTFFNPEPVLSVRTRHWASQRKTGAGIAAQSQQPVRSKPRGQWPLAYVY
jgi:hypothetical protein